MGPIGPRASGGGIYVSGNYGNTITNCTISGNSVTAAGYPFGGSIRGGGLYMNDPNGANVSSSTIVNNTVAGGPSYISYGGGVYWSVNAGSVRNTLIAGNSAANGSDYSGATTTNGGNNLVGSSPARTLAQWKATPGPYAFGNVTELSLAFDRPLTR